MRTAASLQRLVDRLEAMDAIDGMVGPLRNVAGRVTGGERRAVLEGYWLGHALHPLLTDFPLGCWLAAGLLDVVGGRTARPAARRLVGTGLLFVPVTAATGLADWSTIEDPRPRRVGVVHAVGNVAVGGAYLLSWRARRQGRHAAGVAWGMAGGGLAWVTGYLGGHLSFGRGVGMGARGLERPQAAIEAPSVARAS
jgi:uncharacterized membrane protein